MSLSVIIPTHNQAVELQSHLPAIMKQNFDEFEVIVVDMASTDETKDVLENMELRYPTLRHTHTPASARDISLERLAITLGLRAAKYERVVITHANCQPATAQWLQHFSEAAAEGKDIIVGVAKYDEQRHTWLDRKAGFFRLWNSVANVNHIHSGNAAVGADGCNLALRKSYFLSKNGFGDHLNLLTGAEELLVNNLSNRHNTATVCNKEAIVIEDVLTSNRQWKQLRLFHMETRRHLHHTGIYRMKQFLHLMLPWLMLAILVGQWPLLHHFYPQEQLATDIICGLLTLLILILTIVWIRHLNLTARSIGYQRTYYLTAVLFMLLLPLWNFHSSISYLLTPKAEFRKKFV